jgi:hypothetical protein
MSDQKGNEKPFRKLSELKDLKWVLHLQYKRITSNYKPESEEMLEPFMKLPFANDDDDVVNIYFENGQLVEGFAVPGSGLKPPTVK